MQLIEIRWFDEKINDFTLITGKYSFAFGNYVWLVTDKLLHSDNDLKIQRLFFIKFLNNICLSMFKFNLFFKWYVYM